jgi:hypothetical protein
MEAEMPKPENTGRTPKIINPLLAPEILDWTKAQVAANPKDCGNKALVDAIRERFGLKVTPGQIAGTITRAGIKRTTISYAGRGWPDEKIARLRDMRTAGHTVEEIGKELGFSASGVEYRLKKLGIVLSDEHKLEMRRRSIGALNKTVRARAVAVVARRGERRQAAVAVSQPTMPTVSRPLPCFAIPSSGGCQWPMGDINDPAFHRCGRGDAPWCDLHMRHMTRQKPIRAFRVGN